MAKGLKIGLAAAVCVLVAVAAVAFYFLHNPDRYLPRAIAYAQKRTGLQIEARHIAIRWLPLSVRIYDLDVKNPKPFPPGYFLKAPVLDAAVAWWPLLHGQVAIRSLVVDHPSMNFISDPDGLWNFQNPSAKRNQPTRLSLEMISDVQINDGVLLGSNLIDPSDAQGPIVLEVRNFSAQLDQIELHKHHHQGTFEAIQGTLRASNAAFGAIHTTDLRSRLVVSPKKFTFQNFRTKTYRGEAKGDFSFNFGGKYTTFDSVVSVSGIGVPYLLAEFQTASTKTPPKLTGMMQANLKLGGTILYTANPLADIDGAGDVTIRKGEFPGLNDNKTMMQMKRLRDHGTDKLPVSAFSSFTGDVDLHNRRVYSKKININFYGIVVDGSGNTSVVGSGTMNYRGVVTVMTKQGFFIKMYAKLFKGAKEKNGKLKFPIRITGTLDHPQCVIIK
jgi:AsmA family/AsmA-like C-terminal region